jgi:hypothetical protein
VDSLVAIEIRLWIVRDIKAEMSLFDGLSGVSVEGLSEKIAAASKLVPTGLV